MIEFSEVSFAYPSNPDHKIIDNISFFIDGGQEVSIMGQCGCGKSTLLKLMCGLLKPIHGKIKVFDHDINQISKIDRINIYQELGIAFQQGGLFASMNVRDNLIFAMSNIRNWLEQDCEDIIDKYLNLVNLANSKFLFPNELSGGMSRRVAIIRALCTKPKIALLDNPTAGLDPISSHQIINMIKLLDDQLSDMISNICFTSNIEVGITLSSRIMLLKDGKIIEDGPWRDIIFSGSQWAKKILTAKFIKHNDDYLKNIGFPDKYILSRAEHYRELNA